MVQFINSFIPIILTVFGLYIAYQQLLLNKQMRKLDIQKVKWELFEKRFRIFNTIKGILFKISSEGKIELTELGNFSITTNERKFLFENDIDDYVLEIIKKGIEITHTTKDLNDINSYPVKSKEREELCDISLNLTHWFSFEYENVERKFMKYLNFQKLT